MNIQYGEDAQGNSKAPKTLSYDPTQAGDAATGLYDQFGNTSDYQGILSRYNQAQGATAASTQATGNYIAGMYGGDVNYQKLQNNVEQQGSLEGRGGFATNVAMLTNLQAQGAQRVKSLTDQANQALMANNAAGAAALSDLAVKEQDAITTARTNFLSNYFNTQQEARAEASFQTPSQAAALALAQQYPDAGITAGDDLATASQKITSSPTYQTNLGKAYADIQQAQANIGLAGAQSTQALQSGQAALGEAGAAQTSAAGNAAANYASAAQTKTLTGLITGTNTNDQADVQALLQNQKDPTKGMTAEQLQAKYANYPAGTGGAIAARILSEAESQGYQTAGAGLTNLGAETNVKNIGEGGITGFTTGATNWLNTWLSAAGGSQTVNIGGKTYNVGQLYTDGSGAHWMVDAQGHWTKE